MTHFSAALIVPAELRDKANALGVVLGHGPQSYTVLVGTPVTHYGSRARIQLEFIAALAAAGHIAQADWDRLGLTSGAVQAGGAVVAGLDLGAVGLTDADRDQIVAALVSDIQPERDVVPAEQFAALAQSI